VTERVAIVTGGARGIGAATARRLARDGMAVAVVDLDATAGEPVVKEIEAAGGTAIALGADVSQEDQVTAAVAEVAERLGGPTVLVNNAGVLRDNLLFKMSVDDWNTVLGVHLRGAFLMSRAAQAHMVEANWGRIVNLSSTSALGNRGQVNYSAAKAGLIGAVRSLSKELARRNITVNAVAPGIIETEMVETLPRDEILKLIPMRRFGRPEEVAKLVRFLVSDDAAYITGEVISIDGGLP
jgi:3-oxoacyl-[acyl-carrier protein] reductase